jgi:hypothetical protein
MGTRAPLTPRSTSQATEGHFAAAQGSAAAGRQDPDPDWQPL